MSNLTTEDKSELNELSMPGNRFITSYTVAFNIVRAACDSHAAYWEVIDACNKHIEGQKPVNQKDLNQKGMGWVWNFNYGKALAKIQKSVAEAVATTSSSLSLGYVTFRIAEKEDIKDSITNFLLHEEKRGVVASVIGAALAHTLSSETRLSGWLNEVEYASFSFGFCALVFDKFDWMPSPVHPSKIAFRPNTRPESINQFVTFKIMEAEDLFSRWVTARNEKTFNDNRDPGKRKRISSSGWNVTGLEELLIRAFKGTCGTENKKPTTWQDVMPYYQANPSAVISSTSSVTIAKIFHKELDGTITEVYIPWDENISLEPNTKNIAIQSDLNIDNIIYQKNHGKYIQENHICLVRDSAFSTESGFIQEYRGIAKFAVDDSIRYNRTRNGIGNKMQFVGAPMFESPNTQTTEKFKITVSQGFIMLPASHQLVEKQPSFDINSHLQVLSFEESQYLRDTQQYDASIQGRLTSRPNKGEVQQISSEVQFTNAAKRGIKMRDYASIFNSVIKRIPDVKCKKTDVGYSGKKKFYDYIKKNLAWLVTTDADVDKLIHAVDSFVMEPVVASVETITIAMQMAETPFGRNRLKRMMLVAKGFPIEEVNIAVPLTQDKFINMQDARVAAFENDMFFTTNEVILSGEDDDIVHLDSHLSKCQRVIQGVQQGALSPVDAFKYLENNLGHSLQHIDKLGKDPILNGKAEEYAQGAAQLIKAKDQIKVAAEQMMRQQQEQAAQPQVDPETANRIASDNAKTQNDQRRKDWLAQVTSERKDQQMELAHEQKMKEIELKNQNEQR